MHTFSKPHNTTLAGFWKSVMQNTRGIKTSPEEKTGLSGSALYRKLAGKIDGCH